MVQGAIQTPDTIVTCQQWKEKGQEKRPLVRTLLEGTRYLPSPVLLGLYSQVLWLLLASDGQNMESSYPIAVPKWKQKVESSLRRGEKTLGCAESFPKTETCGKLR